MSNQRKLSVTVVRAFAVLEYLSSCGEASATLKDVSKQLGMSKSTAHRYLSTLEDLQAVERDDNDRFRLGVKLIQLAGSFLSEYNLRQVGELILQELAEHTKETVHLAVPSQGVVTYIAKFDSPHSVRMASYIGARMPMYCTSLGKAILAYCLVEKVESIIRLGMPARTPFTITNPDALYVELERVRQQGYALDDQENEMGVRCVGAPIFDHMSRAVGAISVSGPENRLEQAQARKLGPVVREAALKVSGRLGYQR